MDQDLSTTVQSLIDKSISDPEVFLCIFLRLVVQLQVEVFEVAVALSVRLACHIQNVSDSSLDQLTSLEGRLEWSHVNALVDFKETDVPNGFLAVDITSAEVDVGEPAADDLLLLTSVRLTVILLASTGLLLVNRCTSEAGISVVLLQLGDRNGAWVLGSNIIILLSLLLLASLLIFLETTFIIDATVFI